MSREETRFEGVIIGFEEDEKAVIIHGSAGEVDGEIKIVLSKQDYDKLSMMGIGQMIRGRGRLEHGTPPTIRDATLEQ